MSNLSREELIGILLDAGMDLGEAENLLQKDNIVLQKVIQIDGRSAARILPEIAKLGLITGAVNVRIGVEASREAAFIATVEELTGQQVLRYTDFTVEVEKRTEPIDFEDLDDPKMLKH